jgi:hypothetical protein
MLLVGGMFAVAGGVVGFVVFGQLFFCCDVFYVLCD